MSTKKTQKRNPKMDSDSMRLKECEMKWINDIKENFDSYIETIGEEENKADFDFFLENKLIDEGVNLKILGYIQDKKLQILPTLPNIWNVDENTTVFKVFKPIITKLPVSLLKNDILTTNERKIEFKEGYTVQIWLNHSTGKKSHATINIIDENGENYNFGLTANVGSYSVIKAVQKYDAIISIPDSVFCKKLFDQISNPSKKYIELISTFKLNADKAARLNQFFDSIQTIPYNNYQFNRIDIDKLSLGPANKTLALAENQYVYDNLPSLYSKLNKNLIIDNIKYLKKYKDTNKFGFILSNNYLVNEDEFKFCMFSGKGDKRTQNCTTLINYLFGDVLDCGYIERLLVNPRYCKTKVAIEPCNQINLKSSLMSQFYKDSGYLDNLTKSD